MNQIIFTCQYLEHHKQPINGFCLNLKCKDKAQCCFKCVMNKHLDHKERDCKTIYEIQQMTQNDIGQMPNWIQLANQTFRKVEKAQKGLAKLILGERDYLIELKKNLKASNYYLYNKDFLRLKNLNIVIRKMLSPKYKNFFLCILKVMNKIQETLDNLSESKLNERKQVIKNVELNVNFEQIVQLGNHFDIIKSLCDDEQCFDKQQCCKKCYMKNNKEQSIFVVFMPLIELQIKIANQYLFAVETYFKYGQQLYQLFKEFLENQEILFKDMNNHLNRYEDAILCYDQAIKINPNYSEVYYNKGNALHYLNRYEDAILCYDQAIKINPNYSEVYYNKGNALDDLKRYEDAILCYDQAIKINPNLSEVYYNKGYALYNLNRYEDAIQCFNQVLQLIPNDSSALNMKQIIENKLNQKQNQQFFQ